MNRKLYLPLIGALYAIFSFFLLPNQSLASEITPGTGFVFYSDGTKLGTGTFTTNGTSGATLGSLSSISVGTLSPLWVNGVSSPIKKEAFVTTVDTSGKLEVLRWSGTNGTWVLDWTENLVGSASLDGRGAHLAYESSSGDLLVAWGRQNSATNELEYRTYSPITGWAASASTDLTLQAGAINWMELYPHPASGSNQNEIVGCYGKGGGAGLMGCAVWTGSAWGNEVAIQSNTSAQSVSGDMKGFDGFYEQGSGKFISVSGIDASANVTSRSWNGSSWWTSNSNFAANDEGEHISCSAMPWVNGVTNNQGACIWFDSDSDDTSWAEWDGVSNDGLGTLTSIDTTGTSATLAGNGHATEVGWLINGTASRSALMFYPELAAGLLDIGVWQEQKSLAQEFTTGNPTTAQIQASFKFFMNPDQRNKGVLFMNDATSDLQMYKASISGGSIVWNTAKLDVTQDMSSAVTSPYDAFYLNYASPTFNYFRWYQDDAAPGSATAISAENIKASGSEALAINSTYRLRTQISNEGPGSASDDKYRLEFAKAGTSCRNGGLSAGWRWRTVPLSVSVASDAFDMEDSSDFTDGDAIASGVLTAGDPTFKSGAAYDAVATSSAFTLSGNEYSEFEWNLKPSSNAQVGSSYCFRVGRIADYSTTPDTLGSVSYTIIASASVQDEIVVSNTYTQNDYLWMANADNIVPGGALAAENTQIEVANKTTPVRLRMNITLGGDDLSAGALQVKLQYANSSTGPWTNVGASTSSGGWKFYNNTGVTSGTTLSGTQISSSTSGARATYQEGNPSAVNPNGAVVGNNIEYDFALDPTQASTGSTYYFRLVKSNEDVLDTYNGDGYPIIKTGRAGGGDASGSSVGGSSGGGSGTSGGSQGGGTGGGSGGGTPAGGGGGSGEVTIKDAAPTPGECDGNCVVTNSLISNYSNTATDNALMVVGISITNDLALDVDGVTWNSQALTRLDRAESDDDAVAFIYYLKDANLSVASGDVVVTMSGTGAQSIIAGVMTFEGVDQTTPFGDTYCEVDQVTALSWAGVTCSENLLGPASNVTVTDSATGEIIFDVFAAELANNAAPTVGQTERWDAAVTRPSMGSASTKAGASGSVVMEWTPDVWNHPAHLASSINAAEGGAEADPGGGSGGGGSPVIIKRPPLPYW